MVVISRKVYERCQVCRKRVEQRWRNIINLLRSNLYRHVTEFFLNMYLRERNTRNHNPFLMNYTESQIKNLRISNMTTVSADKIKILHEDCINICQRPSVRRAYPLHPRIFLKESEISSTLLDQTA